MTLSTLSLRARAVARAAIAAGVLTFCIAADCAVLAFELGRQTGAAVHARNDQLARVARRVLAPAPAPVAPEPAAPAPEPVAIEPAPAPAPGTDWASLTVRELRSITGARSKRLRKADLVALAAGMAA